MEILNLDLLPDEAKREVLELYENLLKKYNIRPIEKDEVDEFFDKINLDINFNREEANAR